MIVIYSVLQAIQSYFSELKPVKAIEITPGWQVGNVAELFPQQNVFANTALNCVDKGLKTSEIRNFATFF